MAFLCARQNHLVLHTVWTKCESDSVGSGICFFFLISEVTWTKTLYATLTELQLNLTDVRMYFFLLLFVVLDMNEFLCGLVCGVSDQCFCFAVIHQEVSVSTAG